MERSKVMEFFDSHAHYNDEKFDLDREKVIKDIYEDGITKMVTVGYDLESSKRAIEISEKYGFMYATCGISPNDVQNVDIDSRILAISELAKHKKIVAIGEIGLDYYWNKENKELQKEYFIKQINLANKLNLPIVIHSRDAIEDTINILKNVEVKKKGIFHCCMQNSYLIKEALKLGFYISFAGPITFKNSKHAEEVINIVPLEKLLIETDSPYLAPEPKRGTRNDSRNVKLVAKKIADVKNIDIEQVAEITYKNAKCIFNIMN